MEFDNEFVEKLYKNEFLKKDPNNLKIFLKYITARIDIANREMKDNDVIILDNSDLECEINSPSWLNDSRGTGYILQSYKGVLDLKVKCVKDGQLTIWLRGIDFREFKNNRLPIYIKFTEFSVNNKQIFDSDIVVWHDNPTYNYIKEDVKDGEILDLHFEWEPF